MSDNELKEMAEAVKNELYEGNTVVSYADDGAECASLILQALQRARAMGHEEAAKIADQWLRADHMELHAGEMTAQEKRTVKAVVSAIAASIRALHFPTDTAKDEVTK